METGHVTWEVCCIFSGGFMVSAHENYFDSLQKRQLPGGQANARRAIELEINGLLIQFGNSREGGQWLIRRLVDGNRRVKGGDFNLLRS